MRNSEQLGRDLEWVLTGPSLLDPACLPCFEFSRDIGSRAAEVDLSRLAAFVDENCKSHRVGDYFETLVHFALRELEGYSVLLAHHQVFDGPRTVGEIDFLLRDSSGRTLHLEVAVKFFLYLPDAKGSATEVSLIGPNPADNLHRKLEHLQQHQLPLSEQLDQRVDERKILMRGRIHYHFRASPPTGFSRLSPNHCRGLWCRRSEVSELIMSLPGGLFRIQRKPEWLSPTVSTTWLGSDEFVSSIQKHFINSTTSVLFSIMESGEENRLASKEIPVFVVSDTWPEVERST